MFIIALLMRTKLWKQPVFLNGRVIFFKKLWYIYTMEYYSSIKSEILPFASAWMDLEDISKINQRKIIIM